MTTICGTSLEEIRKAYYNKQVLELLNKIQSSGEHSEADIVELGEYLETLRNENKKAIDTVLSVFGGKIIEDNTPPTVEELRDGADDQEWREKADKAIAYIETTLTSIRDGIASKKSFSSNFWGDTAMVFISIEGLIDKDLVYKRQLYKARLTKIIDECGVSRKEAEERAELTKEYFDYKSLEKTSKRLEEFYTFARRRDDASNHR